jgi:hypothetical protein
MADGIIGVDNDTLSPGRDEDDKLCGGYES